ncbi:hypothetical protein L210DRAFT_3503434 [Boletus edulis BED1]|uniref:Uncharacterized protein n=1 Tax=Boletus edulis BED1 TaxID=1328754 RepID=A0AAD4BWJ5_BOLED|nr:hypothetical protein L210DRAFT_3503434 [Boletus edulis BED1]
MRENPERITKHQSRWRDHAKARAQSTTADKENNQHDEKRVGDLPDKPPVAHKPPDGVVNRAHKPQSMELKGEGERDPSTKMGIMGDGADVLGVSRHVEDVMDELMELSNVSEHECECPETGGDEYSPVGGPDELDEPGSEVVARSDIHSIQGHHKSDWNEHDVNVNVLH